MCYMCPININLLGSFKRPLHAYMCKYRYIYMNMYIYTHII